MQDKILLIQALARAVMAIMVVGAGAYLLATQVPVPTEAFGIATLVLGAYFGVEGISAYLKRKSNH